jgi:hypothetical protein
MFARNVGIYVRVYTASQPRRTKSSSNKIFWGNQPRQVNPRNRRFEDHLGLHHQGCDMNTAHNIPVDEDRDALRNDGFFYSSDAAIAR